MAQVNEQSVAKVLAGIIDPNRNSPIIVSGVTVRDGNVVFAIEIDPKSADKMEEVRKAAEQAVLTIPGVTHVSAVLTAEKASCGQASHNHMPEEKLLPNVKAIIAVASGKGGVGKSTTSANLALALADLGLKVGMFDADIFGPSMPRMLGISGQPETSAGGDKIVPLEGHGIKCMSMGFLVPEETPVIWRGPMVMSALEQMLRDVEWGELDVMVIDMPPGTGDTQLTMSQRVPLTGAVIVSTPQDIALLDARKGLNMFRKVDVPVLGIIENMSYYICPKCNDEAHIFGHGGAKREAAKLSCDFLGEIPLDIRIRETSDGGHPIVASEPDSPHAKAYHAIAAKVWEKVQAITGGARKGPKIVVS
jgi:ATP-binding protein involved in chromosome partitioning